MGNPIITARANIIKIAPTKTEIEQEPTLCEVKFFTLLSDIDAFVLWRLVAALCIVLTPTPDSLSAAGALCALVAVSQ